MHSPVVWTIGNSDQRREQAAACSVECSRGQVALVRTHKIIDGAGVDTVVPAAEKRALADGYRASDDRV